MRNPTKTHKDVREVGFLGLGECLRVGVNNTAGREGRGSSTGGARGDTAEGGKAVTAAGWG